MPIYEYECLNCSKEYEIMQKITDKPLSKCPECGGRLHKKISNTSFILKGTGWYATDYASGRSAVSEKSKSEKTAESKPKKKEDSKEVKKTGAKGTTVPS